MKEKILIYLCMNAIFSKTMNDTETQITQFIVGGSANLTMVSNCQYNILVMFYLHLKC